MIAGATRGAGGGALGAHLANAEHNEEVRPGESRGLTATDIRSQIDELTRMASHAKTSTPIYHVHADPPADRPWSQDERARYWDLFEREFGLEGRPFASAIHVKEGREHEHRAYLRIRPDGTAIRLDHDHARREKISRVMEFERGEPFIKGAHNRAVIHALRDERPEIAAAMESHGLHEGTRPRAHVTPKERMQEERTGIDKKEVANLTATAWRSSDNAQAFMSALREQGLTLARGDKTTLVVDATGNTHSLARMLAMSARSQDEASPKAKDIQARLQSLELPSLDDARQQLAQVRPVHDAAPVIVQPDPVPPGPGGGVEVPSQDVPASITATSSTDGKNAPAHTGAHAQGKPSSPKGGGGGGGSAPSHSDSQASPLPSLDVGRGPGEPPGPGAHPDEIARHAAEVHEFQERKEKAWLAFIRAFEAQNKPKSRGTTTGGSDNGVDEKGIREAATAIINEIQSEVEKRATLRAFWNAWDQFKRGDEAPAQGVDPGPETPPRPDGDSRPGIEPGAGHAGRNEATQGRGGTAGDAGNRPGVREDSGEPERGPRTSGPHRTAFDHAIERTQIATAGAVVDMSALRAEMRGPCPLEGLEGAARKARLDELNGELHAEFRASQRQDFSEQVARERMRAHPLAQALRALPRRNLTPEQEQQRQQGWADIKEAHAALVTRLKEAQKANQKAGFLQFLEFRSHTDSRALAVFEDMKAKVERARKIRAELSKGDARVAELRSSEPQGERDPDRAAQAAKTALYDRLREAQEQVKEAQKNLSEAPRPWKVTRWIAAVGFTVESVKHRVSAEQALERAMTHEKAVTPHYLDIDAATGKARNAAVQTERAHAVWRAGPGAELAILAPRMTEIHAAVDRKDWRITEALATTGIDAALDEVRKREEREERKRQDEARKAEYGARMANRGQVVEFPAGPRMR